MNTSYTPTGAMVGLVVEEAWTFSLSELARTCNTGEAQIITLVEEGVLEPTGSELGPWHFSGASLRITQRAVRLSRDLHLDAASVAVVIELLQEIETLRAKLHLAGLG